MATGIRWHGTCWQARVQIDGQQKSETFRFPNSPAGRARALKARELWIRELQGGLVKGATPFFSVLAQDWLNQRDVQRATLLSDTNILNHHWLPPFGAKRIDAIRPGDVREILKASKTCSKTRRNMLGPLRGVFELAIEGEWIDSNPVAAVKIKRHQKPVVERFTQREKARILSRLEGDALLYFSIAFATGMRPSEILALEWEDFDGDRIRVSKAIVRRRLKPCTKNYEVRNVMVLDPLLPMLRPHPRRLAGGPVLANSFGRCHLDTDEFNRPWRQALKEAHVPYRIPYVCRHTRAGELLTAGVEPAYAAKQLGHSVEMFFRTYSAWLNDLRDDEQRALMAKIV